MPRTRARRFARASGTLGLAIALCLAFGAGTGLADDNDDDNDRDDHGRGACSATASAQFSACKSEVKDDFFTQNAICINVSDWVERTDCFADAEEERGASRQFCRAQRQARRDLCGLVGEGRYEPDFDPANFDTDFTNLTTPNSYFPLGIGNVWEYASEDETSRVEVLDKTKLIDGVTCIVVNDRVEGGGFSEDTDDWYGQRKDGTVDYCGESVRDFEAFAGDVPDEFELISIDGSFKAGRDGDLPGTLFLGIPSVGTTYRQEWSPGNAEDAATVLSTTYGFGNDAAFDEFAPMDLVVHLCANDCVVTADFTPIEPGVLQLKYYAPGIGLFLEVDPQSGDVNRLVDCTFNANCTGLPQP